MLGRPCRRRLKIDPLAAAPGSEFTCRGQVPMSLVGRAFPGPVHLSLLVGQLVELLAEGGADGLPAVETMAAQR